MARLIRAQTDDGGTIIDFLDDVMQDRNDGFKCHHRIAAAKELIVHIVRDEQPESVPAEAPVSVSAKAPSSVRAEPVLSTVEGSAHPELGSPEPVERVEAQPVEGGPTSVHPEPVEGPRPEFTEGPADSSSVVPAKEPAEGRQNYEERKPRTRRTRTQRRRDGAARAATLGKHPGSERNEEEKQDKPARVELTPAERRIKEKLEQHWHEPDPWAGPIDSTTPGRSPPW